MFLMIPMTPACCVRNENSARSARIRRDPAVTAYLVRHVVAVASTMVINPTRPIELPFWLATQTDPLFPLFPNVLVLGADCGRANALRSANIEGR